MVIRLQTRRNASTWTGLATAALLLVGCRSAGGPPKSATPDQKQAGISSSPNLSSKQKIFPWSIVAGGVDSEDAVLAAMREDPVVEAHYAGLKPSALRQQRLPEKKQAYVSYRIRDNVYWTRKPVTLAAGELVLTDGESMLRGRCGNRVSSVAREPVAPPALEPPEVAMDTPVIGSQLFAVPDYPRYAVADSTSFTNPRPLAAAGSTGGALPSPAATEPLPPAWTAGGINSPGSGVVGVGGTGGGGGGATPTPPAPAPDQPTIPVPIPRTPVEVAPPLVLVPLAPPPTPVVPTNPLAPPPSDYPPNIPPGNPPPPWYPPQYPPVTPPPNGPPPTNPPPPGPPPTDPPPNNPPPPGPPPPSDPPPPPPPGPPDVPVPEPGAIVMIVLGIAGIAMGAIRRKS